MRSLTKTLLLLWAALTSLLLLPIQSQAMPSFARQTGMNCNSCHIGTDNVPNFTRTGRIFAMRGYTRPTVREKLRHDGNTIEEHRINGRLFKITVTPDGGIPYTLVDKTGDGTFSPENAAPGSPGLALPTWVIGTF